MGRYGRPLGFGIALGIGGAAGCSGSSLSPAPDAQGITMPDADASVDTRDALPAVADTPVNPDTRDALPPAPDLYGMTTHRPTAGARHEGCLAARPPTPMA